jgi:hypothetical protein
LRVLDWLQQFQIMSHLAALSFDFD